MTQTKAGEITKENYTLSVVGEKAVRQDGKHIAFNGKRHQWEGSGRQR